MGRVLTVLLVVTGVLELPLEDVALEDDIALEDGLPRKNGVPLEDDIALEDDVPLEDVPLVVAPTKLAI